MLRLQLFPSPLLVLLLAASALLPAAARAQDGAFVTYRSPTGETRQLAADADDDGDGLTNALEVGGFTYSRLDGLQPCAGDASECFFTDALSWTTDQDPYSDYTEATGINMPRGVRSPYSHPLVAARPVITVGLVRYTVTPTSTITDTEGQSISSSWTNETSNQHEVGGSVTVGAELNPFKLASVEVSGHYSYTRTDTESSTRDTTVDFSTATTVTPERAARLKLEVFYLNLGSADANEVRPSFNVRIGERVIFTYAANSEEETASLLTARNSSPDPGLSRYPQGDGGIVLGDTQGEGEIAITLDELRALEAGAPLGIEVVKIDAEIVRFNEDGTWGCDVRRNCTWPLYEAGMGPVSTVLNVDIGDDSREYHVFAGYDGYDPEQTMRDVLALTVGVEDRSDGTYVAGARFPDDWFLSSPSQALLDGYDADDPLRTPMRPETQLFLATPGPSPGPSVALASYTPDLRDVLVLPVPAGAFPIRKVEAFLSGRDEGLELAPTGGAFYRLSASAGVLPASGGVVEVTDAAGFTARAPIGEAAFHRSCRSLDLSQNAPARTYTIFHEGDPDVPIDVWCKNREGTIQTEHFDGFNLDTRAFYYAHFADRNNGVLVGQNKQIAITRDGGIRDFTWGGNDGVMPSSVHDAHMSDSLTVHVVGNGGNYGVTRDGGASWSVERVTTGNLIGLDVRGADTLVAVGYDGAILLSEDGGAEWTSQASGTGRHLFDVTIVSPRFAAAVGDAGRLSITRGDLTSWTASIIPNERLATQLHSVAFLSEQVGLVVGDGGTILKTVDGGGTWSFASSPTTESLRRVRFVDDTLVVAAGLNGVLLRSFDAGSTWEDHPVHAGARTSVDITNFIGLHVFGPNDYYLVGHRTRDGQGRFVTTRSSFGFPVATNGVVVSAPPAAAVPLGAASPLAIGQSRPNPTRGRTVFEFELRQGGATNLSVYDLLGRRVAVVVDRVLAPGSHQAHLDASGLPSGTYVYRLRAGGRSATGTMVVAR